jgi:hypothetical protein
MQRQRNACPSRTFHGDHDKLVNHFLLAALVEQLKK